MKKVALFFAMLLSTISLIAQNPSNMAKISVLVINTGGEPREGEEVIFTNYVDNTKYTGVTNAEGKIDIEVPKGMKYKVGYTTFEDEQEYTDIELPNPNGYVTFNITIEYEWPKVVRLKNVFFDTGKATLRPESYKTLNNVAKVLKNKKKMVIEIAGHTDNVGKDDDNQKLSENRSKSVRKYLMEQGIDGDRMVPKGYGEKVPVATNETPEGRQENRRTEIKILED